MSITGKKKTAPSAVIPLLRYAHKRSGKLTGGITYIVLASDWTPTNRHTYEVTLFRGKATSCTCVARVPMCKHKEAMVLREQQRRETAPLNGNKPFDLLSKKAS